MNEQPHLSIVIPAYNDAAALQAFLPDVAQFCAAHHKPSEIIVVDDGSRDAIAEVVSSIISDYQASTVNIQLIKLSRNFGKEAALSAGIAATTGELVALMDADGQHPLSVLEQMLTMITSQLNIDAVAAIQADRPNESKLLKFFKSSFYAFMQDNHRYELRANAGDFRIMKRKMVDALLSLPERQRFMKGLYAWVGYHTVYLPFTAEQRSDGHSKFTYSSLFELAIIGITSFSQKPLRWISRMGICVSMIALLYGAFIVCEKLFFGNSLSGWATLAAGTMFSAGLQLICLGVIGEYIGRIYEEVKGRPLYIIDKKIDRHSASINSSSENQSE